MTGRTIRYGLVGCGMMGQEHIRNIRLVPQAYVGAIFEPDAVMLGEALKLAPRARPAGSIRDLLADREIDCVLIASPNFCHLAQLEEIAAIRPLPVLVEKPLFTDPADAERLKRLRLQLPLAWVAMEYRYMPAVARLIADAPQVTGGVRMLSIREHRYPFLQKVGDWNRFNRKTGGTFVEKGCHFFDLMRLILGANPVRVMASGGQATNHVDERYAQGTPDVWDHGYALVDFDNGARAMLELCMFAEGSRYQEELSAIGPEGKIECRVPGPARFWPVELGAPPVAEVVVSPRHPRGPQTFAVPVDPEFLAAGDHNGSTYYQHRRFSALLLEAGKVEVSIDDGWWAVVMGLAAHRSAREGRAIELSAEFELPG